MDQSQARIILGYNLEVNLDEEEIRDVVEEAVFSEVTFFSLRTFLPALASRCIKKLHEIDLAAKVLEVDIEQVESPNLCKEKFEEYEDLLSLLSNYHQLESELKAKLVNSTNALSASLLYNKWIVLFESFAANYIRIFQKLDVKKSFVNQNEIRITSAIEFNDLYRELNELNYNNLASYEYYRLQKLMNISK